jgi:hypothetical protein
MSEFETIQLEQRVTPFLDLLRRSTAAKKSAGTEGIHDSCGLGAVDIRNHEGLAPSLVFKSARFPDILSSLDQNLFRYPVVFFRNSPHR